MHNVQKHLKEKYKITGEDSNSENRKINNKYTQNR